MSTDSAKLADHLSRKATTTKKDLKLISRASHSDIPWPLLSWLNNPFEDWDLPKRLLQTVKNRCRDKGLYME
jgi:hypothetical protein